MSDERDLILYYLKIYYSTTSKNELIDDQQDNINSLKRVVELNPILDAEDRNILNVAYKNAVSSRRNAIRNVQENIKMTSQDGKHPYRHQKLIEFLNTLFKEIHDICLDLIELINNVILPATNDPENRVFYEKLKGDFYRYICENREKDATIEEFILQAQNSYQAGLEIAKSELSPTNYNYLGLVLNYTVFLYEIVDNKNEAIELSQNTYNEMVDMLDQMDDASYSDAAVILQLLKLNTQAWVEERDKI
ncbi:14-3-3 protein beta/alpha-B [Tritrichomonas foetus]|uniref:14-3-3 protein beta/alpha-B n=1 Tax=Tritrichomonas foetus TaxID=1144522 RepID=A0A1J4JPG5_9EUKA|nr:14-3-3 protein beta/alpha-B [Tritrichomonas foetus]|eukprot:OHT00288.1 14-3-3 protein beta/alpha-B [Tritrichomonas foetus]